MAFCWKAAVCFTCTDGSRLSQSVSLSDAVCREKDHQAPPLPKQSPVGGTSCLLARVVS